MRTPTNGSRKRILIVSGSTLAVVCTLIAVLAFGMFGKGSTATHAAGIVSGHATVPLNFQNPNGQHPGTCGTIEFFFADKGNGTVDLDEHVDTHIPGTTIATLHYSASAFNTSTGTGQSFGNPLIIVNATDWNNTDTAYLLGIPGDKIHGYLRALDVVLGGAQKGTICTGEETDDITLK